VIEDPLRGGAARDHLANERTLLSWVRTGVGLLSVGIVVERAGTLMGDNEGTSEFFGNALSLLGCLTLVLGIAQFLRSRRQIDDGRFVSGFAFYLMVAAGSLALATGFVAYVVSG
jgi:putative membrane protein